MFIFVKVNDFYSVLVPLNFCDKIFVWFQFLGKNSGRIVSFVLKIFINFFLLFLNTKLMYLDCSNSLINLCCSNSLNGYFNCSK